MEQKRGFAIVSHGSFSRELGKRLAAGARFASIYVETPVFLPSGTAGWKENGGFDINEGPQHGTGHVDRAVLPTGAEHAACAHQLVHMLLQCGSKLEKLEKIESRVSICLPGGSCWRGGVIAL